MPAKKQSKRKQTKSRTLARRKMTSAKSRAPKRKAANKSAKGKAQQKVVAKRKTGMTTSAKSRNAPRKKVQQKRRTVDSGFAGGRQARSLSGEQSGDLQGLSRAERADSESVDELLEEGNAFEADVVSGVEEADNADQREVHTHEVPEDDVPEEYLDKE
jgi:hypothetical protein